MLHWHPAGSARGVSSALTGYPYAEGETMKYFSW